MTTGLHYAELDTPVGPISFAVDRAGRLVELCFASLGEIPAAPVPAIRRVREELSEYFSGTRTEFELELAPVGTPFQRRVWHALTEIPYGQTLSYAGLARRLGRPSAARAVGQANAVNPIPVVIPCHRVIAADGSIGGYSAGVGTKRRLLALEHGRIAA